jgi:catechol 2,3-dioxygenase-like lactoylglutathione lyase family enzyme
MKFHHVALSITNVDATIRWYQEVFGLETERIVDRDDLRVRVYFLRSSEIRLELFAFQETEPLPEYRRVIDRDIRVAGTKHVAFEVENIQRALLKARQAGSIDIQGPHLSMDGRNLFAFVADPSGILVEFLEFLPTS